MNDVQTNPGEHQPRPARVAERVKVEHLAGVILDGQEVALLASHQLIRIATNFIDPCLPRVGQVVAKHIGHFPFWREREQRRRGRLAENVRSQTGGQARANVLLRPLSILRAPRLGDDVRSRRIEHQTSPRETPQFVRPQARLDGHAVEQHTLGAGHAIAFGRGRRRFQPSPFIR